MAVAAALSFVRRGAAAALDVLLPPRCLVCGEPVGEAGVLCAGCWREVTFLGPPQCACCGMPFPYDAGAGALCAGCSAAAPPFARARAAFRYDEASRGMVLAFKHGDRTHAAPAFGTWMKRAGAELLETADALVPVPLHWTRLFVRRYNQSALLAQAIHAAGGPPVEPDLLVRRRRTPSQGRLGRTGRARNVQGAFRLKPGASVRGSRLVLVDDVLTTGATVTECARILRRAGAERVDVLTLARAGREGI
jgi:ComF family protein